MPTSPTRHFKASLPFTKEQASWVVTYFGEPKSLTLVRRAFCLKFFPRKPAGVPRPTAFHRLMERFPTRGALRPRVSFRRSPTADEEVDEVRTFFEENSRACVQQASKQLGTAIGKVWKILRRKLGWQSYHPYLAESSQPRTKQQGSRPAGSGCSMWRTGLRGRSCRMKSGTC